MSRFDEALRVVFSFEGGFSDDKDDPGGATKYGITEGTLSVAKQRGVVPSSVTIHSLTPEHAAAIYRAMYWDRIRGDDLPRPLDLILFDIAVNSGIGKAGELLQKALNMVAGSCLSVDGAIGPKTMAALSAALRCDRPDVVLRLLCLQVLLLRVALYSAICDNRPSMRKFLRGWIKQRVVSLASKAGLL